MSRDYCNDDCCKHDCCKNESCECYNDWCDPNGYFCNYKKNCGPKCCTPLDCGPADIQNARCVPIIADKIYDCVTTENLQYGESSTINSLPIQITIDNYDATTMISGMPICIDKISTHIDAIGITLPNLEFKVGSQTPVEFVPVNGSSSVATDFKAILNTTGSCCDFGLGTKTKVSSNSPLIFSGVNGRVAVTGRIGRTCFKGSFSALTTFEINDNFPGIYPLNLFTKLCLPSDQRSINLNLSFYPSLLIECITPDPSFAITVPAGVATFNVSAEYSFLVRTELSASTIEKLGVFVSNNEVACRDNCHKPTQSMD